MDNNSEAQDEFPNDTTTISKTQALPPTEVLPQIEALPETTAAPPNDQAAQAVRREMQRTEAQRRRLAPRAFLVGLAAGLLAVAFRAVLLAGDGARDAVIHWAQRFGWPGLFVPALLCAVTAGAGVYVVERFAPEASGSGIPHLRAVLHRWRGMVPARLLPVKFIGGVLALGGGLALGREGPTVQMGGACGQVIGQKTNASRSETRALIAAGAGAGLAAAFNAPLAGMIFVLEEIQRDFRPGVFSAAFVACITGDVTTRLIVGPFPAFRVAPVATPDTAALPCFVVLGAVAGLLGVFYNRMILASLDLFDHMRHWPLGTKGALVGGVLGAIGFFRPELLGGGHELAQSALAGQVAAGTMAPLGLILLLFLVRFAFTMTSYASGASGGIFAPLLVLGAQIGLACALVFQHFFPGTINVPAFAVVGMAAYFTAIVRAPLTGIVLIAEMTGGYSLILPLLAACCTAYGIAEWLREEPIYEALLERSLRNRHPAEIGH